MWWWGSWCVVMRRKEPQMEALSPLSLCSVIQSLCIIQSLHDLTLNTACILYCCMLQMEALSLPCFALYNPTMQCYVWPIHVFLYYIFVIRCTRIAHNVCSNAMTSGTVWLVGWWVGTLHYTLPLHQMCPTRNGGRIGGKRLTWNQTLTLSFYLYPNLLVWRISGTTTKRKRLRSTKLFTCSGFGQHTHFGLQLELVKIFEQSLMIVSSLHKHVAVWDTADIDDI